MVFLCLLRINHFALITSCSLLQLILLNVIAFLLKYFSALKFKENFVLIHLNPP